MNLAGLLLRRAQTDPGTTALRRGRASLTHGELAELAGRAATLLVDRGVRSDDRVALLAPNVEETVVAYLAILAVGGVVVPLNPAAPAAELGRELAVVDPGLVVGTPAGVSTLEVIAAPSLVLDLDGLPEPALAPVDRGDDDLAVLLFTAGTAGAPRAAMLTHGNLGANIRQVLGHPGLQVVASDVTLGVLPLFHVYGLNVALGVGLAAGATVVLVDGFDPARTAALVHEQAVTILAGVPTMYGAWLARSSAAVPDDTFASVRLAVSGAARLPQEVAEGFRARFGVAVHDGYGLTEAAPIVTATAVADRDPQPGSIGPPLPGVEVRVVDADGADVLAGDPGEIWVRGPNVFTGYWRDADATTRVLTADGWLRTGDIAVIDARGELHLVDRAKDLVIVSGFNVYPAEVEDVLLRQRGVAEAAVVGEPSDRTGEAVVAYVVPVDGGVVDADALSRACTEALARYKCPSRIEVVGELPHTLAGKLLRRELRARGARAATP